MIITEEEAKRYPFLLPHDRWYGATNIPQGWHDVVMIMCEEIKVFLDQHNIPLEKYHCNQGKEKWGEFEWYDSFDDDVEQNWFVRSYILNQIVCHYKHILNYTCTQCGKQGVMRHKKPHVEPLCDECFKLENMENYTEIVKLLNSPDTDSVILGLSYLKETDGIKNTRLKRLNGIFDNTVDEIDKLLNLSTENWDWGNNLDYLISKIRTQLHIDELKEYRHRGMYEDMAGSTE